MTTYAPLASNVDRLSEGLIAVPNNAACLLDGARIIFDEKTKSRC